MRKFLIIGMLSITCIILICIGLYKLSHSNKAPEELAPNIDSVKLFMSDVTSLYKNTTQIEGDKINCKNDCEKERSVKYSAVEDGNTYNILANNLSDTDCKSIAELSHQESFETIDKCNDLSTDHNSVIIIFKKPK